MRSYYPEDEGAERRRLHAVVESGHPYASDLKLTVEYDPRAYHVAAIHTGHRQVVLLARRVIDRHNRIRAIDPPFPTQYPTLCSDGRRIYMTDIDPWGWTRKGTALADGGTFATVRPCLPAPVVCRADLDDGIGRWRYEWEAMASEDLQPEVTAREAAIATALAAIGFVERY
jgi:hypothetical protein